MSKVKKSVCPYHKDVALVRLGRANWWCKKCKRNMMLELVLIHQLKDKEEIK